MMMVMMIKMRMMIGTFSFTTRLFIDYQKEVPLLDIIAELGIVPGVTLDKVVFDDICDAGLDKNDRYLAGFSTRGTDHNNSYLS